MGLAAWENFAFFTRDAATISDPYCQALCMWQSASVYRQRPCAT